MIGPPELSFRNLSCIRLHFFLSFFSLLARRSVREVFWAYHNCGFAKIFPAKGIAKVTVVSLPGVSCNVILDEATQGPC